MLFLVTVGSTAFDGLVRALDSPPALRALAALGCSRLAVQRGRGQYEPRVLGVAAHAGIDVDVFRYRCGVDSARSQRD